MNTASRSIFVLAIMLFISACSVFNTPYHFNAVYPETPKVKFNKLLSYEENGKLVISGRVKKITKSIAPQGHVDIAVYDKKGNLLIETTTSYSSSLNLRKAKKRGGNRFSATLDTIPPSGSIIKIAFHKKALKSNPVHAGNIAR